MCEWKVERKMINRFVFLFGNCDVRFVLFGLLAVTMNYIARRGTRFNKVMWIRILYYVFNSQVGYLISLFFV